MRPVPPPLDLNKRTLEPVDMIPEYTAINTTSSKSPFAQKSLPLRKSFFFLISSHSSS